MSPLDDGQRFVVASRLIARTAAKYARKLRCDDLEGDIAGDAWLELLGSVQRFDPTRGSWESFVLTIAARTVRSSLRLARSPVSGNRWRSHVWSAGLKATMEDKLASHASPGRAPDAFAVDAEFMEALREVLMDVPDCELAWSVLFHESTPHEVAKEQGVRLGRVRAAVEACREQAVATLGHFGPGRVEDDEDEEMDDDE